MPSPLFQSRLQIKNLRFNLLDSLQKHLVRLSGGVIQFPTNIVSDRAEMFAECRSRNNDKLEAQAKHMMDCLQTACDKYGATLEASLTKSYCAYSFTEKDAIVQKVAAACEKIAIPVKLIASGGGSDANVFNGMGIDAVDIGTGMSKFHTTEEFITVENLENTSRLVLALATL